MTLSVADAKPTRIGHQGHFIIPGQLEAALRNGHPASVTIVERSKIDLLMSIGVSMLNLAPGSLQA